MTSMPSSVLRMAVLAGLLVLSACASTTGSGATSPGAKKATGTNPPDKGLNAGAEIASARARLESDPNDLEALFRLGVAWQDTASTPNITAAQAFQDSAMAAFDAVLERDADHVKALVHRGLLLEDLNRHDEALAQYQRATVLAPGDPLPFIDLGSLLYFHFHKTYEAKEALVHALEIDGENPDAHFNLGVLFADANLYSEARAEWERVLEIDPSGPAGKLAQENLARILPVLEPGAGASAE